MSGPFKTPRAARASCSAMDGLYEVRNVAVSIRRSPGDVYAFISDGANIPRWAAGLGGSAQRDGDAWRVEGTLGRVVVRFAPPNQLGVADHDVTLETGDTVHNPMRVVPNGAGSTVIFTVLRRPGVTAEQFDQDAAAVDRDLRTLKSILERG
jgi:hypothetical protein